MAEWSTVHERSYLFGTYQYRIEHSASHHRLRVSSIVLGLRLGRTYPLSEASKILVHQRHGMEDPGILVQVQLTENRDRFLWFEQGNGIESHGRAADLVRRLQAATGLPVSSDLDAL